MNAKANLDWLGTTRARLGFVATPDNRLMFYATGGVAYGGGSASYSAFDATNDLFWTGNPSSSRVGWTIGGGVEYAITNNITIKGEYLYYDLGSTNFRLSRNAAAFAPPSRACRVQQVHLRRLDRPGGRELQVLSARRFDRQNLSRRKGDFPPAFFACGDVRGTRSSEARLERRQGATAPCSAPRVKP